MPNVFKRLHKKTLIIGVVIFIVLIALSAAGAVWYINNKADTNNDPKANDKTQAVDNYGVTITDSEGNKAFQSAGSGDIEKTTAIYDERISNADSDQERASQNLDTANALMFDGNVSDNQKRLALKYALEAERLYPSLESAARVGSIYQSLGDMDNANKYYALVNDRNEGAKGGETEGGGSGES
ncbi:MAG TPA: hypothetical protein VFS65_00330 [Candidatus Saccharimonadales bacterium]|nr:hypothetical protein [Candidatus Saccharimonadales bacterium]